jgi:hypothetical protein
VGDVGFDADDAHSTGNYRIECSAKNKSGFRISGSLAVFAAMRRLVAGEQFGG